MAKQTLLEAYLSGNLNLVQSPTLPQEDIAKATLLKANVNYAPPAKFSIGKKKGPSVVQRVLDVLSRGTYASANLAKYIKDDEQDKDLGGAVESVARGLSGKDKTTYKDVLRAEGKGKVESAGLGFALDVLLDPTSYIGVGLIPKLSKGKKILDAPPPPAPERIADMPEAPLPAAFTKPRTDLITPPTQLNLGSPVAKAPPGAAKVSPQKVNQAIEGALLESKLLARTPRIDRVTGGQGTAVRALPKNYKGIESREFQRLLAKLPVVTPATEVLEKVVRLGDPTPVAPKPPPVTNRALHPVENEVAGKILQSKSTQFEKTKTLSPYDQINLWNTVANNVVKEVLPKTKKIAKGHESKFDKVRLHTTYRIYQEVENALANAGYKFVHHGGEEVKLSQVIAETPDVLSSKAALQGELSKFPLKRISQQGVENQRAASAIKDAPVIQQVLKLSTEQIKRIESSAFQSPVAERRASQSMPRAARDVAQAGGTSPAGASVAMDLVRDLLKDSIPPPIRKLDSVAPQMVRVSVGEPPRKILQARQAVTNSVYDLLGSSPRTLSTSMGDGNLALEAIGARFATHMGNKDMRPIVLNEMASARSSATRVAHAWNEAVKGYSKVQQEDAFKVAQGLKDTTDENTAVLSQLIKTKAETYLRTSDSAVVGQSIIERSGITMDELNDALRGSYRFTKGKVQDILGQTRDYSKGTDWLKSWETMDIKDPVDFFYRVENAVQDIVRKKAVLEEIGARFGSLTRGGDYTATVKHPMLDGIYFHPKHASQVQRVVKDIEDFGKFGGSHPAIRQFDKIVRAWKSGVTIYSPSHHIRNLIGDTYLAWMAGVNSPRPYNLAAKVLHANKDRYSDIMSVEDLVREGAIEKSFAKIPSARETLFKNQSGVPFTHEQIYIAMHNKGLLPHSNVLEDLQGEELFQNMKPFGGRVQKVARGVSETRDHYVRIAHFIDAVSKSRGNNIHVILDEAASKVRKWHPDGLDLTEFEKTWLRRIFPFYSWTRKAIPLVVESVVRNPGKTLVYPKGMYALQSALGIEAESLSDPFPTDQLFPEWISEKGIGPLGHAAMSGPAGIIGQLARQGKPGTPDSYALLNPSNPMLDIFTEYGNNPKQGIAGSLNPVARVPMELLSGNKLQTGAPIEATGGYGQYVTDQIPLTAIIQRLTNVGLTGLSKRGEEEGVGNREALINILTALGLTGTGPYRKQAEWELRRERP